jgi:hypothetical protein
MATTDYAELKQLMLQLERDLVAQSQLRTLLAHADSAVATRRQRLRLIKARIKRAIARHSSAA